MSDELFAPLPNNSRSATQAAVEVLTTRLALMALPDAGKAGGLRWADGPPRQGWLEDIELVDVHGGLMVVFHASSADQRRSVIEVLQTELSRRLGASVCFAAA